MLIAGSLILALQALTVHAGLSRISIVPSRQTHQHPLERGTQQHSFVKPDLDLHDLAGKNETGPTRNVQVAHPPRVPKGGKVCTQVLLEHDFGNSYYDPAIVEYLPPTECGPLGSWAAIVLKLTVESNGTQFDRLGSISLDHVEIWRTSTAEPTSIGIVWTALKDATRFNPVFAKSGKLMFDENNLLTETYTGIFKTSLVATFYEATSTFPTPSTADLIIPLSTKSNNQSQMMVYPGKTSTTVTLPNNTAEAYVEIVATGNADEEFWYANVPDDFAGEFDPSTGLLAKGPFREVQLLIDDKLAGVVYPFPVLYTGGANPLLWRPLTSLRAFDVPSFYVDITPFIPLLVDDAPHNFSMIVLGQGPNNSVNSNWLLTGNIQIKLDHSSPPQPTTGKMLTYIASDVPYTSTKGSTSKNGTIVDTFVMGRRRLNIASLVTTGSGTSFVQFNQVMSYSNRQHYENGGLFESVEQNTKVATASTHNGIPRLTDTFSFPLTISTNYTRYPSSFSATIGPYEYDRVLLPPPTAGSEIRTTKSSQVGRASLTRNADGKGYVGSSETSEKYDFLEGSGDTFHEEIRAVDGVIVSDETSGTLLDESYWMPGSPPQVDYAGTVTKDGQIEIAGAVVKPMTGGLRRVTRPSRK